MVIGLLEIQLSLLGNRSLKEKRMVLRSVKDRVRNSFNVSIAEVADHDKWCWSIPMSLILRQADFISIMAMEISGITKLPILPFSITLKENQPAP